MSSNIATDLLCNLAPAHWLIISENVPTLIYYTYLSNLLISISIAFFVLYHNRTALPNKIFFYTNIAFSLWIFFALIFWASNQSTMIMYAWSMDILVEPLVHIGIFYLLYVLVKKQDLPFSQKLILGLLYLPIPLFLHTPLTLSSFDLTTCLANEGPIALYYTYFVEGLTTTWLFIFTAINYFKATERKMRSEILYLGIGGFLFLFAFSWGNIIGSFTEDWQLAQYGLLGMPLFLAFMLYSIVRFNTFRIRLLATPALVAIAWVMLGVLLFINDISKARVVIIINLLFFGILGYRLIISVRKEVKQREEIEKLALNLEKANTRLQALDKQKSEFVSIASHQLRSPLTAIRGYTAMLLDGSYGAMTKKATEALDRIHESAKLMAFSIEDFLNVSRIESGNMKYELTDFNLREQAEHIVDDLRPEAVRAGLLLLFKSDLTGQGIVHADIGKTQQILHNLINNALKYTKQGSITVFVRENKKQKKLFVEFIDTGIGISAETIDELFEKFSRAKNANAVNIKGTGLGLFVAREMARAMQGDISVHSDGEGKGSCFILTLPLIK